MSTFDREFLQKMKEKLDMDLIGAAAVDRSAEIKEKASLFLPTAKTVVVFAKETYREVVSLLGPTRKVGEPEIGDVYTAHSNYINGRLNRAVHELAGLFHQQGYRSIPLCVAPGFLIDQRYLKALFSYKHAAVLAGLGTIGRNGLLITSEFGPRVRLACLLTEAPLEETHGTHENHCVNCDVCIQECPAQAIGVPAPGQTHAMNPFACRAYRQAGLVCSICLKVCDEITG